MNTLNTLVGTLIVLGGLGLFFGLLLSFAGAKLKVKSDPKLESLKDILPGVNCGGCGRAGCGAFAEDVFAGKAESDGCPVGGAELNHKIADLMGVTPSESTRMTAYVKCIGADSHSLSLYQYQGMESCRAAIRLAGGGAKACTHGCLGGGSCKTACMFDAIRIIDGVAVIDNEKCTGCKMCIKSCPRPGLIEMVPYDKNIRVGCNARDGGKAVRANCNIGCIGCKLCVKRCEHSAIHMEGQLAQIIYERCTNCGSCAEACPRKVVSA